MIRESRSPVQDNSFFFVSAIRKGTTMKLPNVGLHHKPTLRLKKLDKMFKSEFGNKRCTRSCSHMGEQECPRTSASSSLNFKGTKKCYADQVSCSMEDGISKSHHNSPPKMDGFFSNEGCIKQLSDDCCCGGECIDNDDIVFSSMTLKEIQNMCKSRQRSASLPNPSKTSDLNSRRNCKKRSHAHVKPPMDDSDLEETLGTWRSKLPTKKMRKKKRGLVASLTVPSSASEVPVRIKQENAPALSCGNSEVAALDCGADVAACSSAGCDQEFVAPINTVFESQNVEDMPGDVKVKSEEPESSPYSSTITDCQNQNDFGYESSKSRIQNDGSCSATEITLQDNDAFDRICPHSGNTSCHDKSSLYTLPVTDKVDHLEALGHVSPICVTNRMPLEVPSNDVCSGNAGSIPGNVCSQSSQSCSFMQKETSSLVANDVVIQLNAAEADDGLDCFGEFVSVDSTLNSVDISNGINSTESVANLDTQSCNSKLRITSFEGKAIEDSDTVNIKNCLEQNSGHTDVEHDSGHTSVPKAEGEPPARVNSDNFNPDKDKFSDTSNEFLISRVFDVQSTTGNGKFHNPPPGQLDEGPDCSFKFVPADGSFNSDDGSFSEARPVLRTKSFHPKLGIMSVRENAGEQFDTTHTEGCLQQNNEPAHIPDTPGESPVELLVDKKTAKEDRSNISSEVPTSKLIQPEPASPTGNYDPTFATKVLSDMRAKQAPKKLFVKRKAISPTSQEKLCKAMDEEESYKSLKAAKQQGIYFDKSTKSGTSSPGVGSEEVEDAAEPVSRNVTSIPPTGSTTYSANHDGHPVLALKNSPPLATKGILKPSCGPCIVSCSCPDCSSIRSYAQKSIDFSQQQMRDIQSVATNLVRELKSLTSVIEENLLSETCSSTPRYSIDEVKSAASNAAEVEKTTRRWLSMMSRDCSRFCKIMKLKEKKPAKVSGLQKEQKKITFADEAGGLLCHVKVFGDHSDSSSVLEKE